MNILVVEDNPIHADAVASALRSLHYSVVVADDGEQAIHHLRSTHVDAIVLDENLPGMSGIEVLHWIRAREQTYGVIFLTSCIHEVDVVLALEAGADDYMAKPFRMDELTARVGALLRRVAPPIKSHQPIQAGNYVFDPITRSVTLCGNQIDLTTKEFQLAASLFTNLGRIISRDLLVMMAWERELSVYSRSLDTHIYRLRRKLQLCPENGLRLSSIYTFGYRLELIHQPTTPNTPDPPKFASTSIASALTR